VKACGMSKLTPFVIDELSLLRFSPENLDFMWPTEKQKRNNKNIYVAPSINLKKLQEMT